MRNRLRGTKNIETTRKKKMSVLVPELKGKERDNWGKKRNEGVKKRRRRRIEKDKKRQ